MLKSHKLRILEFSEWNVGIAASQVKHEKCAQYKYTDMKGNSNYYMRMLEQGEMMG